MEDAAAAEATAAAVAAVTAAAVAAAAAAGYPLQADTPPDPPRAELAGAAEVARKPLALLSRSEFLRDLVRPAGVRSPAAAAGVYRAGSGGR